MNAELYCSYGQFFVYDKEFQATIYEYAQKRSELGIDSNPHLISVHTLIESGRAYVEINKSNETNQGSLGHVVEVPLEVLSGSIIIDAPDDLEAISFTVPPGHYRLVIGQDLISESEERVVIRFEQLDRPLKESRILKTGSYAPEGESTPDSHC